ncbi:MAG: protein kinase [Acidobacteria bacterium]|nr:protein kinase [Acidobacteriota bacterium]MBV9436513.1 protein kinase [Acidobacteriota bacterium]
MADFKGGSGPGFNRGVGAPTAVSSSGSSASGSAPARGPAGSALQIGDVLADRYRILDLLGQGGMGAVYKAEDLKLSRFVAVKVIRRELAADPSVMQRFRQELILARDVTHQNVIRLYDIGEANAVDFITMEFVDGEDLSTMLARKGKLSPDEAADIVSQICAGLQAAHAKGIIHRDLKPGNILRENTGRIVVMDFGLARTLETESMTRSGALVGTFEYMSPEQAQNASIDARSDLYTVGLIFYELLTGDRPFRAESAIASLLMRTQQRAKPPSTHDSSIPKGISGICEKCLEITPASRYQSAGELVAEIANWKSPAPVRVQSKWPLFAIVGALVVAVAAIAALLFLRPKTAATAQHAPVSVLVADFSNQTGDSVFDGTLEPMFNLALEGASFVNAFDRSLARTLALKLPKPSAGLDEEHARLVAISQGVSTVVTGELTRHGSGYSISTKAVDAVTGKVLATNDINAANKDEVVSKIPNLAAPIRKALGDTTPASVQFEEVAGGFTADSLEALHENAIGVEQQFAGKFDEAFQSFQKATELDPKFAGAYTGMVAMAQNLGRPQDAEKYMKLAMEHVDRMTDRERYRSRGLYYLSTGDSKKCVEEYNQLVSRYPADRVGQNNLASCYTSLRDAPKALEAARKAVEIVPKGVGPRLNLAFISVFAGDFASGEKETRAALDINPAAQLGSLPLAEAQLGEGQLQNAAQSYHKLETDPLGKSVASSGLADLAAYEGRHSESAHLLEQGANTDLAAKMPDNAARKFVALAEEDIQLGRKPAALAAVDKALAGSKSVPIRFLAARVYVEAGDTAKAQKLSDDLSGELTAEPQAYGKIIAGMLALKKDDSRAAIKNITDAQALLDTWIGRFELGRAYLEAGAFTDADSEFDRCNKRRGEAMELFMDNVPTYSYFPLVYYYQGRVREGMKSEGFVDFYKTYLSLRGAANEDPLLADIRHRVSQ